MTDLYCCSRNLGEVMIMNVVIHYFTSYYQLPQVGVCTKQTTIQTTQYNNILLVAKQFCITLFNATTSYINKVA